MKKLLIAALLSCAFFLQSFSQKPPAKFGKVTLEEVSATAFQADSSIEAAILFDYGYYNPKEFEFTRHTRIKIYHKEGLEKMIMGIPTDSKSMIKGYVHNLENGKIVSEKIDKESIFKERVIGRYTRMRVAPPNAREGSVVEIRYITRGLPDEWKFQSDIPVLHSEIVIPQSEYVTFKKRFVGYEPLSSSTHSSWVARNMPAFRPEPFINSSNNYLTTMFIDVSEIHIPASSSSQGYYKSYSSNWNDVYKYFWEDDGFESSIKSSNSYLKDAAEEIESRADSDMEKLTLALENIRETVTWNDVADLWPDDFLREIYVKEKTGTSADMNFLFIKLCNMLGLDCYPAIMSTRAEGCINPYFPCTSRFNYAMSYAIVGAERYFIDAADKHSPIGLLPERCLNERAFVLTPTGGKWFDVDPNDDFEKMIYCNLVMSDDGLMDGSITVKHSGYASVSVREDMETYNSDDAYLEEFEQENKGILVMDYEVKNKDQKYGDLVEIFEVEADGGASKAGDMIYLNAILLDQMEENPFKLEKREYPVDFATGMNRTYILSLTIPEGYTMEQLPDPIRLKTSDESATFQFQSSLQNNTLGVITKFNIKKAIFIQDEYEELKSFFNIIVGKLQEPIILKKAQP